MVIETKLDFKKYLQLMYVLTYRQPMTIFLSLIGLIMLISSSLYFLGVIKPTDNPPYIPLLIGFFAVVVLPFTVYRSAKKLFSSAGRLQEKIIYEFTDDSIKITGETFNSELSWEKTYKILELDSWVLIYQNKIVANVIPKESFGEKINDFKNIIKNKTFIKQKLKT